MTQVQGFLSKLLFGKNPETNSPTYSYQNRQSRLVFSASLPALYWCGIVGFGIYENLGVGIFLAFSVLYGKVHYTASTSADAVFDSLWERINLQSQWLNFRLTHLEDTVKAQRKDFPWGQNLWATNESYDGRLSEAWNWYPEKEEPKPE